MKPRIQSTVQYIRSRKKMLLTGLAILVGVVALVVAVMLFMQSQKPKIIYNPVHACTLLMSSEAQELLGDRTVRSDAKEPIVTDNVATSRCGYTDGAPDVNAMRVAALMVRSAVNDNGVEQNYNDFTETKAIETNDPVPNIGDDAYFDVLRGQLNVLDGGMWIILSYGIGSAPEANTLDDATKLAEKIVPSLSDEK